MTADVEAGAPPAAPSEGLATLRRLHDLEVGSAAELARVRESGARTLEASRAAAEEAVRAAREHAEQSVADAIQAARGAAEAEARLLLAEAEKGRPALPNLTRDQRRALRDRVLGVLVPDA
jgi:vacuolar-type H+-ATPase subunit H